MAEQEQVEGEKKKFSKKLIIIIAVAVVILLAGGGGAVYFFMKGGAVEAGKVETHDEEASSEKFYFDMSKPMVVDFPKESSARLVQVAVSMLVEDEETIAILKKNEPMVRNNLMMLISAQSPDNLNTREGKDALRKAMLKDVGDVLKKMAGKGQVKEIFFTSFVMQ